MEIDPRLIGDPNEAEIFLEDKPCLTLVDSGSMVTTISHKYVKDNLPDHTLYNLDQLEIEGPSGEELPYLGFVEVELSLPVGDIVKNIGTFPVLVVPDTSYRDKV